MSPSANFTVFPAIDLRGGQVVRLKEGDPNRETRYSADPAQVAQRWVDSGASWLHVVNLDGAFDQRDLSNRKAVEAILAVVARANVNVQFGGGMRSLESIRAALDSGVTRAILGTVAVEQPAVLAEALSIWGGERVGVSIDARDGYVQVRGWQSATPLLAQDLAQTLKANGLRWLVFTDIARDGLPTGINLSATVELARASDLQVIASGGVNSLADVENACRSGLAGIIIGRALYEGAIDPRDLRRFQQGEQPC